MQELTPEEKAEEARNEAEWQEREEARKKRDREDLIQSINIGVGPMLKGKEQAARVHNLCILTAGCLHSMTVAGLYSMALGDQAVEAAEAILDRIERGPVKDPTEGWTEP